MGGSRIEIVSLPRQSEEEGKMGPAINDVRIDRELGKGGVGKKWDVAWILYFTSVQNSKKRGSKISEHHLWMGRKEGGERATVAVSSSLSSSSSSDRAGAASSFRGLPLNTSAKFLGFWTPSPFVRKFTQPPSLNSITKI